MTLRRRLSGYCVVQARTTVTALVEIGGIGPGYRNRIAHLFGHPCLPPLVALGTPTELLLS